MTQKQKVAIVTCTDVNCQVVEAYAFADVQKALSKCIELREVFGARHVFLNKVEVE